jgi:hypothetical protein
MRAERIELRQPSWFPAVEDYRGVRDTTLRLTEHSHKYAPEDLHALALEAGLVPERTWIDADALFSVHYLTVPRARSAGGYGSRPASHATTLRI